MSDAPDLSVIVVSWNVRDDVLACLESVERTRGDLKVQVILVDNDSMDGTVEAVAERFPGTEIVASELNLGFPLANNLGLRRARGRHVLLLNPDAVVHEGAMSALVAELDGDEGLGIAGPRIEYPDGRLQPECGRRDYRLGYILAEGLYLNALFPRSELLNHQLMPSWDHRTTRDVEAVSGSCMAIRRTLLEDLGGLPSEVFMYHEDLAICLRTRQAGFGVRCVGEVLVVHRSGASAERSPSQLDLLEGEVRVRLVNEAKRPFWWLARVAFGVRSVGRTAVALVLSLPGFGGIRRRFPHVASVRSKSRQLQWAIAPRSLAGRIPRPPAISLDEVPLRDVRP